MKKFFIILTLGVFMCLSAFLNISPRNLNLNLNDLMLNASATCEQIWVDKNGDGINEEYVYYCGDDDDPWWGEDDRWTLADYPCISSATAGFSVDWDGNSFAVSCSGSYTVDHYVSKCGSGGELTSCWAEMC